jgi:hypothetical protein
LLFDVSPSPLSSLFCCIFCEIEKERKRKTKVVPNDERMPGVHEQQQQQQQQQQQRKL